jgi:tetratricopeptide (TPR) repeat protein
MEPRLAVHQRLEVSRVAVVVALALALAPGRARGDTTSNLAHGHVEKATAAFTAGKYGQALQELTFAYALDPDPSLLFAIGQVHVKLGDCDSAIRFYQRFLDSHPADGEAAIAREAIAKCAQAAEHPAAPEPPPQPAPVPAPVTPPPAPAPVPPRANGLDHEVAIGQRSPRPWYTDGIGDTLAIAGIAAGVASAVLYDVALSDHSSATGATTYQAYQDDLDHAHALRTGAIVACSGGAALVVAAIVRYGVHDRSERIVAATPAPGGAAVTYGGRF